MNGAKRIEEIEREIDEAFASSRLLDIGYAQSVWTLLSFNEDHYLKHLHELGDEEMHVYSDIRLNALAYPLRVAFEGAKRSGDLLQNDLIDRDYQLAWEWLEAAEDYAQFNSIFPLWHRKRIEIEACGDRLVIRNTHNSDRRYEAYNRLVRKEARKEAPVRGPSDKLMRLLIRRTTAGTDWFRVRFNRQLTANLVEYVSPMMRSRYTLPNNWQFATFSLEEFRAVFMTIQAMMTGWHLAKSALLQNGLAALGYRTSVWVTKKDDLAKRLRLFTGINLEVVQRILDILTLGSNGIRYPDIATQPLVDLENEHFALAPFVWLNTNAERNLCALLNQIPSERAQYLSLVDEKEVASREEAKKFLSPFRLAFAHGPVKGTNLDLAIIDHRNKVCLCLELKWFIEPAEIREVEDRTKELARGIGQAKVLQQLFDDRDRHFLEDVLKITPDYSFFCAVGSVNWIGMGDVQDTDVPIVKVWHLLHRMEETKSLTAVVEWLRERCFLPREGEDFSAVPMEIKCGRWKATWYGIKPSKDGAVGPGE